VIWEEIMAERGLSRAPRHDLALDPGLCPRFEISGFAASSGIQRSGRVDETYVRIAGNWTYL